MRNQDFHGIRPDDGVEFGSGRDRPRLRRWFPAFHRRGPGGAASSASRRFASPATAAEANLTPPAIVERGAHHRVWQSVRATTLPDGRVRYRTNGYTELVSGLHFFWDGQWHDARAEIQLFQDGAVAVEGAHRVSFAHNARAAGSIDLVAADGRRFRSHVLGLAFYDPKTGASELIAELKDAIGELHPPNVVIYPDAFTDVKAGPRT